MGLKRFLHKITEEGIRFPYAYDPISKKPSITLLFAYTTFILALISTICLHFWLDTVVATGTSIAFFVITLIFYRLRKLDKAKIDFDDKSIELEGSEKEDNETEDPS